MSRLLALALPAATVGLVLLAACVGDDPPASNNFGTSSGSSGSSGTSGGTNDGGGSSGTPACKGDTIEACGASCTKCTAPTGGTVECVNGACQPKCTAPQTLCGDTCVDTSSSATHCGKCDHSCGAGQCSAGACQPFAVTPPFSSVHGIAVSSNGLVISADKDVSLCTKPEGCTAANLSTIKAGLNQLNDVTVSGTNVYFDANEGDFEIVYSCPLAGCPGTGPAVVESEVNDSIGRVIAGPTELYWNRYQSYYGPYSHRCRLPACSSIATVRPEPTTGPYSTLASREMTPLSKVVSVGAVSVLWATGALYNDNSKQLRACPLGLECPTPIEIDTAYAPVSALTYFDGKHYGASSAAAGTNVVFSVSDASPGARTLLVSDAAGISDVAVDASGIYWVNGTTGKVLRCATLTGCAGSGETLATGQTGALRIALDAKFVYWMTPTSVMKVAK